MADAATDPGWTDPDHRRSLLADLALPKPSEPRRCFYVPVDAGSREGYIPSIVVAGEPGHAPLIGHGDHARPWYWGPTYEQAKAIAAEANAEHFGLTEDEVSDIVTSSITAQTRADAQRAVFDQRYNRARGLRP